MAREGHGDTATAQDTEDTLTLPGGAGGTYGPLPEPTKAGYSFGGWFTGPNGTGTRITRHSPVRAGSLTVYARWVEPALRFGQAGCPQIDVGPFEPICTHPEISGSDPLTLNIPVPTYAPIVPPQECVCFEFEQGKSTVDVKPNCVDGKIEFTLDIKPAEDCCSGKYKIAPEVKLDLPCVPFEAKDYDGKAPLIHVTNLSGDEERGVDGGVTKLELVKNCCNVHPTIDIAFPDCLKYWDRSSYLNDDGTPKTQVTYWERDAVTKKAEARTWTLVSMVEDAEHCNTYPVVNPLTIPSCSVDDASASDEAYLATAPDGQTQVGKIKVTVSQEACKPKVSVDVTQIKLPSPSGLGVGTGGPVLQAANGNLFAHAPEDGNKATWYGGGIGNTEVDAPDYVNCRGPDMRNDEPGIAAVENLLIPCDLSLNTQQLVDGEVHNVTSGWSSSRAKVSNGAIELDPQGHPVEEQNPPTGYKFGNLDMVLPSGFQWHARGVATVMSRFIWSPSGLLSTMNETSAAVLLSPAPSVWGTDSSAQRGTVAAARSGANASGLDIAYSAQGGPLSGLVVDAGDGLRVFGLNDGRTTDAEMVGTPGKMGELEIYAHDSDFTFTTGHKLALNDVKSSQESPLLQKYITTGTSPTFLSGNSYLNSCERAGLDADYTLPVVFAMHDMSGSRGPWRKKNYGSSANPVYNGVPTDLTTWYNYISGYIGEFTTARTDAVNKCRSVGDSATRTALEATNDAVASAADVLGAMKDVFDELRTIIDSLRLMNVHVCRAGVITAVDVAETGANVPRRTDPPATP